MKVEAILRKVPMFKELEMDIVLFESKYPVLFTCKNGYDIYLFSCCLVNSKVVKWIATKTNYEALIKLLQDKITIREAFLNVSQTNIIVEYDGENVQYDIIDKALVPSELLPTADEYMDVEEDEYAEEIALFESRNRSVEFRIKPCVKKLYIFNYTGHKVRVSEDFFNFDSEYEKETIFRMKKLNNCNIAYV